MFPLSFSLQMVEMGVQRLRYHSKDVSSVEETRVAWERETERSLAVFQSLEEERYVKIIF